MAHSPFETRLHGIMVVVFIKKQIPVLDDESLQVTPSEGIGVALSRNSVFNHNISKMAVPETCSWTDLFVMWRGSGRVGGWGSLREGVCKMTQLLKNAC